MKAKVYLHLEDKLEEVSVSGPDKPEIEDTIMVKWQHIVNLIARLVNVPTGLIMKVTDDSLKIFLKNNSEKNIFEVGESDPLGCGVYCETVIGKDHELLVVDALSHEKWYNNPEVKWGMISYYGLPIKWPDGEFFGTICVMDTKENHFSEEFKSVMKELRNSVEKDLALLMNRENLVKMAEYDSLTEIYNRRKIDSILNNEFKRSKRSEEIFSVVLIDLNGFKAINDNFGHEIGDKVLINFASSVSKRIRSTDYFGRWGGDEFLIVLPYTKKSDAENLIDKLYNNAVEDIQSFIPNFSFSYGIAEYNTNDEVYDSIIKRADDLMYYMKKGHKTR
ncbi:MAG: sensor domain-containing diguanylate cyclase [Firmicutes bacterium]|jgi:diguanylate cyclase (GGDEF)-like protein|nr:sensor domain-containing diguanylate cyclase [Bacillota bacterium]